MVIESATLELGAKTGEAIATYNYQDIEDGSGYVGYNLYQIEDSVGVEYRMSKSTPYSTTIVLEGEDPTAGTHTYTFFTGTFATPKVIEGTALFQFGYGLQEANLSNEAALYVEVKIYHYDPAGPTSTQIGSTWRSPTLLSKDDNIVTKVAVGEISCPRKKFRKGHQIKIEVINTFTEITDLKYVEVGIDPQNRDGTILTPSVNPSHTTKLTMEIPFRLKN